MDKIEVLHLYRHCKIKYSDKGICELCGVDFRDNTVTFTDGYVYYHEVKAEDVTPLLRPLSSMSEEEETLSYSESFEKISEGLPPSEMIKEMAKIVDYLRSINLDVDGLLQSGQAEEEESNV